MREIVLVGGGEHARVVAGSLQRIGDWNLLGYVDPSPVWKETRWLGTDEWLFSKEIASLICCIGKPGQSLVSKVAAKYAGREPRWINIIDPTALVADTVNLGRGIYVAPKAFINVDSEIGHHSIINSGAIVEHDCKIGNFVFIAPGVVLGGGVTIGDNSFVGLGAHIRDHLTIGSNVVVGMGSVVLKNVPDDTRFIGTRYE